MGCGCGSARRAYGGLTSAQTGQPLSPVESAQNAIANAGGGPEEPSTPNAGGVDEN